MTKSFNHARADHEDIVPNSVVLTTPGLALFIHNPQPASLMRCTTLAKIASA
jgi:hypothetical protein